MYKRLSEYIEKNNMLKGKAAVVLGLSGGADSVCLLLLLKKYILDKQYNIKLVAVHVNHGIRGEEADADAEFSRRLCEREGLEYRQFYYDVPAYSKEWHLSCEEAGRKLRYEAFKAVAQEYKSCGLECVIAVAHHKNDQAETVIHNIIRGAALRGAMAIRPVRDGIIRPLLCFSRAEIEDFLLKEGQGYCTDSTNLENEYIRNKLRNNVIGYLEREINTGTVANLCRFADKMAGYDDYITGQTEAAAGRYVKAAEECVFIKSELLTEHPVIRSSVVYNALELMCGYRDLEEKHVNYLLALFDSQSGSKINLPRGVIAQRTYEGVLVKTDKVSGEVPEEICLNHILQEKTSKKYIEWNGNSFEAMVKSIEKVQNSLDLPNNFNKKFPKDLYTKYFDYDKILKYVENEGNISFCLRGRLPGDYFVIDKKGHTKKLKQYFIENKIPEPERTGIPLFALGNNIIWIAGRRGSSQFLLDESSRMVLVLHMIKSN